MPSKKGHIGNGFQESPRRLADLYGLELRDFGPATRPTGTTETATDAISAQMTKSPSILAVLPVLRNNGPEDLKQAGFEIDTEAFKTAAFNWLSGTPDSALAIHNLLPAVDLLWAAIDRGTPNPQEGALSLRSALEYAFAGALWLWFEDGPDTYYQLTSPKPSPETDLVINSLVTAGRRISAHLRRPHGPTFLFRHARRLKCAYDDRMSSFAFEEEIRHYDMASLLHEAALTLGLRSPIKVSPDEIIFTYADHHPKPSGCLCQYCIAIQARPVIGDICPHCGNRQICLICRHATCGCFRI
jgi:hypothetical protein